MRRTRSCSTLLRRPWARLALRRARCGPAVAKVSRQCMFLCGGNLREQPLRSKHIVRSFSSLKSFCSSARVEDILWLPPLRMPALIQMSTRRTSEDPQAAAADCASHGFGRGLNLLPAAVLHGVLLCHACPFRLNNGCVLICLRRQWRHRKGARPTPRSAFIRTPGASVRRWMCLSPCRASR